MQAAVDLHEAGVVERGDDFGFGFEDARLFLSEHGEGDVGVLDGEGSAEAAALVFVGEFDEAEAADLLEELEGAVGDVEHAEGVAGGVIGDGVGEGGADVGDAKMVGEQFGELEDAGEQELNFLEEQCVVLVASDELVVLAHHGDAGGGRNADGFGVAEGADEVADERDGLSVVAGVVVHLSAACLGERELDGVAEAFEHAGDGDSRLGEEGVVVTGDEECDAQGDLRALGVRPFDLLCGLSGGACRAWIAGLQVSRWP